MEYLLIVFNEKVDKRIINEYMKFLNKLHEKYGVSPKKILKGNIIDFDENGGEF